MKSRQAHVVGAGLAGLAVAACLAQRKWTVTVHERTPELREIGAGIGIKENSIRVMEELRCFEPILQRAHRIDTPSSNDRPGHNLRETSYGPERVYTVRRRDLHRELAKSAESWGANIKLNSVVVSVSPGGRIATTEGEFCGRLSYRRGWTWLYGPDAVWTRRNGKDDEQWVNPGPCTTQIERPV